MTEKLSQPRLLTIPREIRDLIYSHLTRELTLRTVDKIGAPRTIVTLHSVPYVNIMLVHSRIYNEYREILQKLSATVFYVQKSISRSWIWPSDVEGMTRDREAMLRVKTATLRFQCSHDQAAVPWDRLSSCLNELAMMMPALQTLRLSENSSRVKTTHIDAGLREADAFIYASPEVTTAFPEMSLHQGAAGRRVFYEHSTDPVSHRTFGYYSFRALTYSERSIRAHRWTAHEARSVSQGIPQELLDKIISETPAEIAEKCRSWTSRIEGWVEKVYRVAET